MRAWLLIGLAVVGCKADKLKWNPQVLTALDVGDFKFALPQGWRDLSESADPRLARMATQLGAESPTHILVGEAATNTDSNISLMLADLVGRPTCEQWTQAMEMQGGGLHILRETMTQRQFGTDDGCSFRFDDGAQEGKTFLRFHSPKFVTLQCIRPKTGDADADTACDTLAAALAQ